MTVFNVSSWRTDIESLRHTPTGQSSTERTEEPWLDGRQSSSSAIFFNAKTC
ncbi:hypothetical protein LEMLEM_LOCUS1979, partial [Lemmus lemmus]